MKKVHVGIDLHKRYMQVAALDEKSGEVTEARVANRQASLSRWLARFEKRSVKAVVESGYGWYWLVESLEQMGHEVVLSNPVQTKAVAQARVKTDKVDARMLAYLSRADLLPTCWISDPESRKRRELLRHRMRLVQQRTRLWNTVHAMLAKQNLANRAPTLQTKAGRQWLKGLKLGQPLKQILDGTLEMIEHYDEQVDALEKQVTRSASRCSQARRLMTIPGIGPILSMTILAEMGPASRFLTADHLAAYSGLTPTVHASGGKIRYGKISKQGNPVLRWALVEGAMRLCMTPGPFRDFYRRVRSRKGMATARVACARKLGKMMYHMLNQKIDYDTFLGRASQMG